MYVCVSRFSSEKKNLVWPVGITFYFVKMFYIEIVFFNAFSPHFPTNLTIAHSSQLNV